MTAAPVGAPASSQLLEVILMHGDRTLTKRLPGTRCRGSASLACRRAAACCKHAQDLGAPSESPPPPPPTNRRLAVGAAAENPHRTAPGRARGGAGPGPGSGRRVPGGRFRARRAPAQRFFRPPRHQVGACCVRAAEGEGVGEGVEEGEKGRAEGRLGDEGKRHGSMRDSKTGAVLLLYWICCCSCTKLAWQNESVPGTRPAATLPGAAGWR